MLWFTIWPRCKWRRPFILDRCRNRNNNQWITIIIMAAKTIQGTKNQASAKATTSSSGSIVQRSSPSSATKDAKAKSRLLNDEPNRGGAQDSNPQSQQQQQQQQRSQRPQKKSALDAKNERPTGLSSLLDFASMSYRERRQIWWSVFVLITLIGFGTRLYKISEPDHVW